METSLANFTDYLEFIESNSHDSKPAVDTNGNPLAPVPLADPPYRDSYEPGSLFDPLVTPEERPSL